MPYPAKTKGYRLLTVAGERCRWKLKQREYDIAVTLQSAAVSGARQAVAVLPSRHDLWLALSSVGPCPELRPLSVTPALVRRIAAHALALGWQPQQRGPILEFVFDKP